MKKTHSVAIGFPFQLSPRQNKTPLSIPAVDFTDKAPSLSDIFNDEIKIYITPDSFFETRFRDIFQGTRLRHTTAAESKKWLSGPNMQYWSQQLNFAVFSPPWDVEYLGRYLAMAWVCHINKGFLYIPRVFHDQANFVSDGWNSECVSFAR